MESIVLFHSHLTSLHWFFRWGKQSPGPAGAGVLRAADSNSFPALGKCKHKIAAEGCWLLSQVRWFLFPWESRQEGAKQRIMQRGRKWSEAKSWVLQLSAALLCLLLMSRVLVCVVCASSHSGVRREAQRKEKTKLGGG